MTLVLAALKTTSWGTCDPRIHGHKELEPELADEMLLELMDQFREVQMDRIRGGEPPMTPDELREMAKCWRNDVVPTSPWGADCGRASLADATRRYAAYVDSIAVARSGAKSEPDEWI